MQTSHLVSSSSVSSFCWYLIYKLLSCLMSRGVKLSVLLQLLFINKGLQILHPWLAKVPDVLGIKLEVLQCGLLEWLFISSQVVEPSVVAQIGHWVSASLCLSIALPSAECLRSARFFSPNRPRGLLRLSFIFSLLLARKHVNSYRFL